MRGNHGPNVARGFDVFSLDVNLPAVPEELNVLPVGNGAELVAAPAGEGSSAANPIDVEGIEDEVEVLTSASDFPQRRNVRRRTRRIFMDEVREGGTGVSVTVNGNKRRNPSQNGTIVDCEVYSTWNEYNTEKRQKVASPAPEPAVVIPKEPTFTCPVCMNELVEPCSTKCGHIFCQECIKQSIQRLKKCPTCRGILNMRNFHRVYLPTATK